MNTTPRYAAGTVLSYEDMANPRATYTVVRFVPADPATYRFSSEYELRGEDGSTTFSDCRQAGWRVA